MPVREKLVRFARKPLPEKRDALKATLHPSDQPETASATPAPARHVGGRAGLVEKHQPPRIKPWLEVFPYQPRRRHVGALRLGGVHGFF
jgi:hypothetical protein